MNRLNVEMSVYSLSDLDDTRLSSIHPSSVAPELIFRQLLSSLVA